MSQSVKKRADVVYQDFIIRSSHNWLLARAIRETMKFSQSYFAKKMGYHAAVLNTYENGGKISKSSEKDILDYLKKVNFSQYSDNKTDDFIIYTVRVMSNYLYLSREWGFDEDDEMVKKLLSKNVSMLCFEE